MALSFLPLSVTRRDRKNPLGVARRNFGLLLGDRRRPSPPIIKKSKKDGAFTPPFSLMGYEI